MLAAAFIGSDRASYSVVDLIQKAPPLIVSPQIQSEFALTATD
jgi:hypothetical protein